MKFLITFSAILVALCSARPHLQPIDCVYPQTIVQNGAATVISAPPQLIAAAPTPVIAAAPPTAVTAYVSASGYPYLTAAHEQYHAQDTFGQYQFGYNSPLSSRHEVHGLDGVSRGTYSYYDSNGVLQTVNYDAGPDGFHVAATNLPKAPQAEAVQAPVVELSPATETPEVSQARAEHLAAHERFNAGIYPDLPKAPETPELKPVEDEPAVAAAKAEHLELVKKIAAGEVVGPTVPESANLPQPEPVTDEPVVALAKQQHLAIHKAITDYDNYQKSIVTAVGPYGHAVAVAPYSVVQPTPAIVEYAVAHHPQQVISHEVQPVVQHVQHVQHFQHLAVPQAYLSQPVHYSTGAYVVKNPC